MKMLEDVKDKEQREECAKNVRKNKALEAPILIQAAVWDLIDYIEMLEKMKEQLVNNYGCLLKENEQLKLLVGAMGVRHRYEKQ